MLRKGISPEARVAKLTHECDEEDFFFFEKLTKKMMLIYITSADNNSFLGKCR